MRKLARTIATLAVVGLVAAACGDDSGESAAPDESAAETTEATAEDPVAESGTIAVPDDFDTIQAAVDAASPGDLILISPGVYEEAVDVTTDELTIRGLDRNETILDGGFELENGIRVLGANGVAVENITARNYTVNGFFWNGVDGYRGSYLTAIRNGDYGIYAFDSVNGLFEHSLGSGSPDAGLYVGQCYPCNVVMDDVIGEWNGLGYSGTNSGGELYIVNSVFRNNRVGVVPNSGSYELCYPERESTIVGNLVYSNGDDDTPSIDIALLAREAGIVTAGGVQNRILRNRVFDHGRAGIAIMPFLEEDPVDLIPEESLPCEETKDIPPAPADELPDSLFWDSMDNTVEGNVVSNSGLFDIAYGALAAPEEDPMLGNCFSDNTFETSAPLDIETVAPCEGEGSGDPSAGAPDLAEIFYGEEFPEPGDYKVSPEPEPQENMPDAATAAANPATNVPPAVDIDAIEVPPMPEGVDDGS